MERQQAQGVPTRAAALVFDPATLLAVVGFLTGRPEWLDIAITYGLLNVISTLAILKFFRHGDLAYDAEEEGISRVGR